jgi:hypothetical protein
VKGKYEREVDRESAYELLQAKIKQEQAYQLEEKERLEKKKAWEKEEKERPRSNRRTYNRKSVLEKAADTAVSTIGRELGRTLIRGLLGSLKR